MKAIDFVTIEKGKVSILYSHYLNNSEVKEQEVIAKTLNIINDKITKL